MNFRTKGAADSPNPLFSRALANMEPSFSLYGWAEDEAGLVDEAISSGARAARILFFVRLGLCGAHS